MLKLICLIMQKNWFKKCAYVDTSSFALKTNLASLKAEVDELDIDKLVPFPVDLSKLSDVVKNDVVKKTVYDKLVAKVNSIDASDFVLKTKYNADKTLTLVVLLKKQTITQKLLKLKRNLLTIIKTNILQLQNLIL